MVLRREVAAGPFPAGGAPIPGREGSHSHSIGSPREMLKPFSSSTLRPSGLWRGNTRMDHRRDVAQGRKRGDITAETEGGHGAAGGAEVPENDTAAHDRFRS